MAANKTVLQAWTESAIKSLVAEKCKPYEIYRRMCDMYREAGLTDGKILYILNISISLVWFDGTSTIVGYLRPNFVYIYIYMICKHILYITLLNKPEVFFAHS